MGRTLRTRRVSYDLTVDGDDAVEDPRLSRQASGLLATILGSPDGSRCSLRSLAVERAASVHEVTLALRELVDEGYLVPAEVVWIVAAGEENVRSQAELAAAELSR